MSESQKNLFPPQPTFSQVVDSLFTRKDPEQLADLTADLNTWERVRRRAGRDEVTTEDTLMLFRRFYLTLHPTASLPIPTEPRGSDGPDFEEVEQQQQREQFNPPPPVSEFAPRPGARSSARSIEEVAQNLLRHSEGDRMPSVVTPRR